MRCAVASNRRNLELRSLAEVDRRRAPLDPPSQRAKQPSRGGSMAVYPSTSGFPRELELMWREETMVASKACPSFGVPTDEKSRPGYCRYGL